MFLRHVGGRSFGCRLLLGLLLSGSCGCAFPPLSGTVRDPPYCWGLRNESKNVLGIGTAVTYVAEGGGTFDAISGALGPGTSGVADGGRDPIPTSVHVHVADEAGRAVRDVDVPVRGHIPDEANFAGTLFLVVTDAGVTLVPTREDWRRPDWRPPEHGSTSRPGE